MRRTIKRATKLSDSIPKGSMSMSGLIRTTTGYCVATCEVSEDGKSILSFSLGPSQTYPEHVVPQHKRTLVQLSNKAMGIR